MREPIAREIIFAIGDNMVEGLEPLLTKTLAPSLYQVYLHADDFERIRTILPQIEDEAKEHLNRLLADLGRGVAPAMERVRGRISKRIPLGKLARRAPSDQPMKFVPAAGDWSIRFQEDPNERLERGEIEVLSELAVAEVPSYGGGNKTQRISVSTTRRLGRSTSERSETPEARDEAAPSPASLQAVEEATRRDEGAVARPAAHAFATVSYQDDRGPQRFEMVQEEIVIGRAASQDGADLLIRTRPDVSRRHAKIRRNPQTGGFWIEDLSQYGTAVNGRTLPPGVEVELPDAARISLASVVELEFAKSS